MYVWFDFHHECRKMKYENLAKLVDLIKQKLTSFNYFSVSLDYGLDQRDKYTSQSCRIDQL